MNILWLKWLDGLGDYPLICSWHWSASRLGRAVRSLAFRVAALLAGLAAFAVLALICRKKEMDDHYFLGSG